MNVAGFKGFNGFNPSTNANSSAILQQQLQSRALQQSFLFGQMGNTHAAPSGHYAAPSQHQYQSPQTQYGVGQTNHAPQQYNSSLQNQFAMKFLFSLMQALTAVNSGFGSFLGR